MRGKSPQNVRARLAPLFILAILVPPSGTLIHSWSPNDQLSAPGQNSVGTVGQNSIGANTWITCAAYALQETSRVATSEFLEAPYVYQRVPHSKRIPRRFTRGDAISRNSLAELRSSLS